MSAHKISNSKPVNNENSSDAKNTYSRLIQNVYINSSNIFYSHTPDGKFTFVSPQVTKILGYRPEQITFNFKNLLTDHPFNSKVKSLLDEVIEKHIIPDPFEIEIYSKDRSRKWFQINLVPIIENGKVVSIDGAAIDITERKIAEELLVESENKYRLLVENQKDFILKFDTKGNILYVSSNYLTEFGIEQSEILGKKFLPEIHPDDQQKVKPLLAQALKPSYTIQHEERMKTVNGWRWISWSNKPIYKSDNTVEEIISVGRDITEKKLSEIELISSEEQFRNVINSMPDLVIIGDYNDNTLFINKAMKSITGISIKDLNKGDKKFQFVHELDREKVRVFKDKFLKSKNKVSEQLDNRFINIDGEIRWHSSILTKITYENKPAILYLIRDITERKESEEEIRKLALIAKETINGVTITDAAGYIEWVNDGFERITGYKIIDVLGCKPADLLQGENTSRETINEIRQSLQNQVPIKTEILNYRKNGESFWNELIIQPIYDSKNELVNYIGLIADISERKEHERAVIFSEEKFSKAFHSSPNAILISRLEDGKIIDVNEGFKSIFEYSKKEAVGRTTIELDLWKYSRDRELIVQRLSAGKEIKNIEVEFNRKSKESGVVELSMDTILLNNEKCIISTVVDITEKIRIQNILQENQSKLRSLTAHLQNVRETERKDIARGIHDELGQILTALKMNIKLLNRDINNPNQEVDKKLVSKELDSLSKMVDESVKSAKKIIKDLRPELLDKLGLVAALEQHLSDYCKLAGLNFNFQFNEEDLKLNHDLSIGIFRTVQEALNNTVKYAKATKVNVSLIKSTRNIQLSFEDNGIGFKPDLVTRRNSFGLFGMRERVLNFGGSFNLESEINVGTKISIDIPLNK